MRVGGYDGYGLRDRVAVWKEDGDVRDSGGLREEEGWEEEEG